MREWAENARVTFQQDAPDALRIPKPIDIVQLQTTASVVYTANPDTDFQIEHLVATNVTGVADFVTVYFVPSGGSVGAATTVVFERAVPARSGVTIFNRENVGLLQPDMTLQALCGVNDAINLWGLGYDYQGVRG